MNVNIACLNEIKNCGDFVNIIINESFDDQARIDSNSSRSYVDFAFCKKHNLQVLPLHTGGSSSCVGAGETRASVCGSTNLVLTFAEEKFVHNFQIIDGLFTNIVIGFDFMSRYNCFINLSQKIFFLGIALGIAQTRVPLVIKKMTLGRAELRKQVTLQPHTQRIMGLSSYKINKQPICLVEPTTGVGIVGLSIAQESAAEIYPPRFRTGKEQHDYPRPNGYGNRHRSYLPN